MTTLSICHLRPYIGTFPVCILYSSILQWYAIQDITMHFAWNVDRERSVFRCERIVYQSYMDENKLMHAINTFIPTAGFVYYTVEGFITNYYKCIGFKQFCLFMTCKWLVWFTLIHKLVYNKQQTDLFLCDTHLTCWCCYIGTSVGRLWKIRSGHTYQQN